MLPEEAGLSGEEWRKTNPWLISSIAQFCWRNLGRPSIRKPTGMGGGLLPDDWRTNTVKPVAEVLQEKQPYTRVPPV